MAELNQNNVYANGTILEFTDGEQLLNREPIEVDVNAVDNSYHVVTQYDRIDILAYNYYKDSVEDSSKYWWIIADANNITNPLDLSDLVGTRIVIPDIIKVLLTL